MHLAAALVEAGQKSEAKAVVENAKVEQLRHATLGGHIEKPAEYDASRNGRVRICRARHGDSAGRKERQVEVELVAHPKGRRGTTRLPARVVPPG